MFGIVKLSIEELFDMKNGYTPSTSKNEYWEGGNIPWFRMEDIRTNGRILYDSIQYITKEAVKGNLFKKDSIILSTSATIGEHALIKKDFMCNQRFTCLTIKDELYSYIRPKYIYYYSFILDEWCKLNTTKSSFASVDMDRLRKYLIPIPTIEEQDRIIDILDRFDKLCNDLTIGLPAEIEMRKKQYEYYRDKLLSFK